MIDVGSTDDRAWPPCGPHARSGRPLVVTGGVQQFEGLTTTEPDILDQVHLTHPTDTELREHAIVLGEDRPGFMSPLPGWALLVTVSRVLAAQNPTEDTPPNPPRAVPALRSNDTAPTPDCRCGHRPIRTDSSTRSSTAVRSSVGCPDASRVISPSRTRSR